MKPLEITFLKPNIYFNLNLTRTWKCAQIRIPKLISYHELRGFLMTFVLKWGWWAGTGQWSRNEATMKTHAKTSPLEDSTTLLHLLGSNSSIKGIINKPLPQYYFLLILGWEVKWCTFFFFFLDKKVTYLDYFHIWTREINISKEIMFKQKGIAIYSKCF